MLQRIMVLCAVAGLLAFAFAAPRADLATPARRSAGHRADRDSLRILPVRANGAALPSGIDPNKIIRQVNHGQKPDPPRKLANPLPSVPFMPAPNIAYKDANNQDCPAVAYSAHDGLYLVVWQDDRQTRRSGSVDIYGARVKADGTLLDPTGFVICNDDSNQYVPAVAFDGTNYLVVWMDDRDHKNNGFDIYGALVSTKGEVTALTDPIANAATDQANPSIAFNYKNADPHYLVVWENQSDGGVHGALVKPNGIVYKGDFPISDGGHPGGSASVASNGNNYFVVWDNGSRTYGNTVTAGGAPGTPFRVSQDEHKQEQAAIASDGSNYLGVWTDYRNGENGDVFGALFKPDGTPVLNDDIRIAVSTDSEDYPSAGFDGTQYLVVWVDYSYLKLDGRHVDPANGDRDDVFQVMPAYGADIGNPAVAGDSGTALVTCNAVTGGNFYKDASRIWARFADPVLARDVGADSILRPVASFLTANSGKIPPQARIRNYGSTTQGTFDVVFSITADNVVYNRTKSVLSLAAGATCIVDFDGAGDSFDLATKGLFPYTVACTTLLSGDMCHVNDYKTALFQGCNFIDFADFGDSGLTHDDHWGPGDPSSPWTLPPMDAYAWGVGLTGSYGYNENSYLTSPVYEAEKDNPGIAFQHNVSTEASYDGGNFAYYSTKTGSTWIVLTPSAGLGYNPNVVALGGPGWSGSYDTPSGWKQSVFTIPVKKDTQFQVRWHFASDESDVYHGWLIDEVAGINCHRVGGFKEKLGRGSMIDTVNVFPTLVHGPAQVSYTLVKDCKVTVSLYDASGRLAARVPTSGFKKGKNTARLDASGLARGVYFVKVEGETDTQTTKVIIE